MQPPRLYLFLRFFKGVGVYGLCVEHRRIAASKSLVCDLAQQLLESSYTGKVVVVTDRPVGMLSAVKKQWLRLERKVRTERASTLNLKRITDLSRYLAHMQATRFTARPPREFLTADITFATANYLTRLAPDCKTMYITYDFPKEKLHIITSWMPRNGAVVIYDRA
jgi:hypothetical protein